jgi:hypothetical protein
MGAFAGLANMLIMNYTEAVNGAPTKQSDRIPFVEVLVLLTF